MHDASGSHIEQCKRRLGEIAVVCRRGDLVRRHPHPLPLPGIPQQRVKKVPAPRIRPIHDRRAHDQGLGVSLQHCLLAFELAPAKLAERVRGSALIVGARRLARPVKDVVCREENKGSTQSLSVCRQCRRPKRIGSATGLRFKLASVGCGRAACAEDQVRGQLVQESRPT